MLKARKIAQDTTGKPFKTGLLVQKIGTRHEHKAERYSRAGGFVFHDLLSSALIILLPAQSKHRLQLDTLLGSKDVRFIVRHLRLRRCNAARSRNYLDSQSYISYTIFTLGLTQDKKGSVLSYVNVPSQCESN